MTRVVSVTQNPVARDTRAFKVAASVSRFGFESVVVEGEESPLDRDGLPFELVTIPPVGQPSLPEPVVPEPADAGAHDSPTVTAGEDPLPEGKIGVVGRIARVLPEWVKRPLRPGFELAMKRAEPLFVLMFMLNSNRRILRHLPRADVYYLHSFWHFPAAWWKAKRCGARLIYDAHDANWVPDPSVNQLVSTSTLRMLERVDRLCANRVTGFLTVGGGLAGLLEERLKRRPVVLQNCHDFRIDEPSPSDIRSVAGLSDEDFLFVMTGAAKAGDTVEVALEVLESLPDNVHLALVGKDHQPRQALVDEHGLNGRVHLMQPVPPTQVASFIRTADASPILYQALSDAYVHSLPNRFFHAIAAGLPILYPPLHEIKAICEEHDLGIPIDPTDADSTGAGMRKLIDDPELASRYAANVEGARGVLSWEHVEPILDGVVRDTLNGTRRSG